MTLPIVSNLFEFKLDGASEAMWVKTADGGHVKSWVVTEGTGTDYLRFNHGVKGDIEPFSMEVGMAFGSPMLTWIDESLRRKHSWRNGAMVYANENLKAVYERRFFNALISEVTIPALDAKSTESLYMTVKFQAESVEQLKARNLEPLTPPGSPTKQKSWAASRFLFDLEGIDCAAVSKVDSITIKQQIGQMHLSDHCELVPTGIEFPGLTITLPFHEAGDFIKWHDDYVMKRGSASTLEKTGAITFLNENHTKELFTISLAGVGITGLKTGKLDVGQSSIQDVTVELYVDTMTFELGEGFSPAS